jgi:hypothetical protein
MHYPTIQSIREANTRAGYHFFSPCTMRFFRSRLGRTVYGGKYFVTSEQFDGDSRRFYSIRQVDAKGSVSTVGEFQKYTSNRQAVDAIRELLREESILANV